MDLKLERQSPAFAASTLEGVESDRKPYCDAHCT